MVHGVEWASPGPGGEPESSDSMKAFGAVVQALREHAGLSREEFGARVHLSKHSVASIELGRRLADQRFVELAEGATGTTGAVRGAFRHMSRQPGLAAWFRTWARLEREAVYLATYECRLVPGMLQSEGYARAVFSNSIPPLSDEQLEAQVAARLGRQSMLRERPNTSFSFVVDEHILRRRLGDSGVSRGLLDHMLACAQLRNVEIQVMPLECQAHAGLDGPLALLETPDGRHLAYAEGQETGRLIADGKEAAVLHRRYATLRAQALNPLESVGLLERIRGAL
ncbi:MULTISPECIES: helix-turn-helix domain-containing protein [Streptomyces]|uniref:Helix-turn-helix domain-containing protein n=1 Tax=Streptomyces heilongjiangensis TaxID=945052 RepID=A0ABW1B9K8_9ACTN|nr:MULTISPECIES: helix-turn-helix transcriptional regulator [Streptomyces]MDC2947259.1 helix-turn-helix transcriptional regulator [Streptomyces heilongjiangensis]